MSLARRLARNAAAVLGTQLVLALLGLVATAVLARVLGAEQLGAWSLIGAVVGYGALLDFGLGVALIRRAAGAYAADDREAIARALGATLAATAVLGLLGAVTLAALAGPLATLLGVTAELRDAFLTALRLSAVGVALTLPGIALGALPTALQRLDALVRLETAVVGVTLAGQLAAALAGGGLVGLAAVGVVGRLGSLAGRAWLASRLLGGIPLRLDRRYAFWSELGRFGALKALHQASSQLVMHLDRFVIAVLVSLPAVAYYTVALELAQRLLLVQASVSVAFYPAACAAVASRDRSTLVLLYERTSRVVAFLTLPLAAGLALFAAPVLRLWVGETFAARSTELVWVLAAAYAGMALTSIPAGAADALGRPDISARYGIGGLALNMALTLVLVPWWGILGAGVAVLGNVLLQCPWFIRTVTRDVVGIDVPSYVTRTIGRPLVPTVALVAAVLAAKSAGLSHGAAGLATGALLGGVVFVTALRFAGIFDLGERRFLGKLPGGRMLQWLAGR